MINQEQQVKGLERSLEDSLQQSQFLSQSFAREKEDEAASFKPMKLKDLFPINFLAEKEKFFEQSKKYYPRFAYKTVVSPQPIPLHTEYGDLANKILLNSPSYKLEGQILNQDDVRKYTCQYLDELGLKDYVQLKFQFECLPRTSVSFFKNKIVLKIRTPLSYTRKNLEGVLNHEIGTHIIRTLNHRENCIRKPSEKGKLIEQGLAAINQQLPQEKPFLFKPALRYLSAIYASKFGFVELYEKLNKWVKDPTECWRQCVRVKRGIGNTEQLGGFYKDQNYLIGAVQILQNRQIIDFQKIYYGKLTPEETKNLTEGVLPTFINTPEKMLLYRKKLNKIALCNFID